MFLGELGGLMDQIWVWGIKFRKLELRCVLNEGRVSCVETMERNLMEINMKMRMRRKWYERIRV